MDMRRLDFYRAKGTEVPHDPSGVRETRIGTKAYEWGDCRTGVST